MHKSHIKLRAAESGGVTSEGELLRQYFAECRSLTWPREDVMSDIPKSEAALMLLRSMNPQVIAMDEISLAGGLRAAASAVGCGVRVIATAHAASVSDLKRRNVYRFLFWRRMFLIT